MVVTKNVPSPAVLCGFYDSICTLDLFNWSAVCIKYRYVHPGQAAHNQEVCKEQELARRPQACSEFDLWSNTLEMSGLQPLQRCFRFALLCCLPGKHAVTSAVSTFCGDRMALHGC